MPDQHDLLPLDLDPEVITARARRDALKIREAYRRRGRWQVAAREATPAQVRAYLDALREILGESNG